MSHRCLCLASTLSPYLIWTMWICAKTFLGSSGWCWASFHLHLFVSQTMLLRYPTSLNQSYADGLALPLAKLPWPTLDQVGWENQPPPLIGNPYGSSTTCRENTSSHSAEAHCIKIYQDLSRPIWSARNSITTPWWSWGAFRPMFNFQTLLARVEVQ